MYKDTGVRGRLGRSAGGKAPQDRRLWPGGLCEAHFGVALHSWGDLHLQEISWAVRGGARTSQTGRLPSPLVPPSVKTVGTIRCAVQGDHSEGKYLGLTGLWEQMSSPREDA